MPSVLKTYYAEALINLLAAEAWHIRAVHHGQEIDMVSIAGGLAGAIHFNLASNGSE